MTDGAAEAAALMRNRGLGVLLDAARERIGDLGGVRGTILVRMDDTGAEALSALTGYSQRTRLGVASSRRIALVDLDAALRASRFGVGLTDVLVADGGSLVTRSQRLAEETRRFREQLERLEGSASTPSARAWVRTLSDDSNCAQRYRRLYADDTGAAEGAVRAVAAAIAALGDSWPEGGMVAVASHDPVQREGELVAVFAARVTGDPHAFDAGTAAGSLFVAALAEQFGPLGEGMRQGEMRAFLFSFVGLEIDDVSSTVLAANLPQCDHPVVDAMALHGGGWPLPLGEVRHMAFAPSTDRVAYVVENPQVFAFLVRRSLEQPISRRASLICPAGFPSAAAVRLLDSLAASGCRILYGGDFDRNGLAIASSILDRFPGARSWHMSPEDYTQALGGSEVTAVEPFTRADQEWLASTVLGPLLETARTMAEHGLPAYQERLVSLLAADLTHGCV